MNQYSKKAIEALALIVKDRVIEYYTEVTRSPLGRIELPSKTLYDNCQKIAIALCYFQMKHSPLEADELESVIDETIQFIDLKTNTLSSDAALYTAAVLRNNVEANFRVITGKQKVETKLSFMELHYD